MTRRRKPAANEPRGLQMSDHALIRLLERSGMDVQAIRTGMEKGLERAHAAAVALGGADHLITVDGLSFVVRDGIISTVMDAAHPMTNHARLSRVRHP